MPKYSVDDVLDIIKSLSAEEKIALQSQLPAVLGTTTPSIVPAKNQQSQSFGNITMRDSNEFEVDQISSKGSVNMSKTNANLQSQTSNLQEALKLLIQIKKEVATVDQLNVFERKDIQSKVEILEEELKKKNPDKDLISHAVEAIEKGLKGVERLLEPTVKVAKLVGAAIFM